MNGRKARKIRKLVEFVPSAPRKYKDKHHSHLVEGKPKFFARTTSNEPDSLRAKYQIAKKEL